MKDKEYIICAAIWYDNDIELIHAPSPYQFGWTLCGHRHHQIIELYHSMTGKTSAQSRYQQGFLTNTNRFVSRVDAGKIALAAGQLKNPVHELTSEDLY